MTDRERFVERWRGRCPWLEVEYHELSDGKHQVLLYPRGCGFYAPTGTPCRDTAKEVWAAAEDAMLERYGEPCEDVAEFEALRAEWPNVALSKTFMFGEGAGYRIDIAGWYGTYATGSVGKMREELKAIRRQFSTECDIRLRQADEFMRRCQKRQDATEKLWGIDILCAAVQPAWYKAGCCMCDPPIASTRYPDWIDALLEIEPAVEKAWAERGAK